MKQIIIALDVDREGPVVEEFKDWLMGILEETDAENVSVLSFDSNDRFAGDVTARDSLDDMLKG